MDTFTGAAEKIGQPAIEILSNAKLGLEPPPDTSLAAHLN